MKNRNISVLFFASAVLMACGGGGGSVDSEVVGSVDTPVDDPVVDTPVDETPVVDVEIPSAEDVSSTEDLVLDAEVVLKPTIDVEFEVALTSEYDGAIAVLCVASDQVPANPTPASLDFGNCVFNGQLVNGTVEASVSLASTVEYLFSAVISSVADDKVVSWSGVTDGQTLLVE